MSLIEKIFGKQSNELLVPLENYQGNNFYNVFSYTVKKMLEDKEITKDNLYTSMEKYLENMSQKTYEIIKKHNYETNPEINKEIPVMNSEFIEYGISSKSIKDEKIKDIYFKDKFSKEIPEKDELIKKEISFLLLEKENTF